jgi:hypothetical protein
MWRPALLLLAVMKAMGGTDRGESGSEESGGLAGLMKATVSWTNRSLTVAAL